MMYNPYNIQYHDQSFIRNGDVISWVNERGEREQGIVKCRSYDDDLLESGAVTAAPALPEVEIYMPYLSEVQDHVFCFHNPEEVILEVCRKEYRQRVRRDSIRRVGKTKTPLTYNNGIPIKDGDWVAVYSGCGQGFIISQLQVLTKEEMMLPEEGAVDYYLYIWQAGGAAWVFANSIDGQPQTWSLEDIFFICRFDEYGVDKPFYTPS